MFTSKFKLSKIRAAFELVDSWEKWDVFEREWLEKHKWPQRDSNRIGDDLDRLPLKLRGRLWEPYGEPYDVSPDLRFISESLRLEIFSKLEPEAAAENEQHPERYGKMCVYCRYYTRAQVSYCDRCRKDLLPLPLNED